MSAASSLPRPSGATFLKPAAPKPATGGTGAGASAGPPRGVGAAAGGEKKAGVNQEYDSFMEEMKDLGAF